MNSYKQSQGEELSPTRNLIVSTPCNYFNPVISDRTGGIISSESVSDISSSIDEPEILKDSNKEKIPEKKGSSDSYAYSNGLTNKFNKFPVMSNDSINFQQNAKADIIKTVTRRSALRGDLHTRKVCCCGPGTKRYIIAFLCSICLTIVIGMRHEMYGIVGTINSVLHNSENAPLAKDASPSSGSGSKMFENKVVRANLPWGGNNFNDYLVDCLENALFFAYIIGSPIGGYLTVRHDSSFLLGCSVAITCGVNLFLPLAESLSQNVYTKIGLIIFLRLLQGLAEGCLIPAVFGLLRFWSPDAERSTLVCLAVIGVSLGPLIGLPVCTYIEKKLGYGQVVFYIYANMGLIWCVFWWRLVDEKPLQDKKISQVERIYLDTTLTSCKSLKKNRKKVVIPWTAIFTSKPVFAILVTYAADDWTFQISSVCMQIFYKEKFTLDDSNIFTYLSIPFLSRSLLVPIGGFLADLLHLKTSYSWTTIRKTLSALGFGLKGVFFVAMGFAGSYFYATVFLSLSLGFSGLAVSGYAVNVIDLSPNFSGLVMGFANTMSTFTGIFSTFIATQIVKHQVNDKTIGWRIAFFLAASTQFIAAIVYLIFGDCREQSWSKNIRFDEENKFSKSKHKKDCNIQSRVESDESYFNDPADSSV